MRNSRTPSLRNEVQRPEGHRHDAREALRGAKLRVTPARLAIVELLMAEHGPFSVEQIHERARRAGCDRVTVYRTLGSLEKSGLVERVELVDEASRYEWAHRDCVARDHAHHHHVLCRRCGEIEAVPFCLPADWTRVLKKMGYAELTHSLGFTGICAHCSD